MGAILLNQTPQRLSPSFAYRDINHVLQGGQSLSAGENGTPVLSTTQPYDNMMLAGGILGRDSEDWTSLVPLVEATRETGGAAFSSLVTKIAREQLLVGQPVGLQDHAMLLTNHGTGGAAYEALKKGTPTWDLLLAQVAATKALVTAAGKSYVVRGVVTVHGETDCSLNNQGYGDNLIRWQRDYQSDIQAITGQTQDVIMFHTQISSHQLQFGPTSTIATQQLSASLASQGKIVMVGPKYMLPYSDGLHLTNEGYRWMGEYYAKAYRRVILEGLLWEPLRPVKVTRSGAEITVRFAVPVRPLVLDTTGVTDPGDFGFEYTDDSSPPSISYVDLVGPSTVKITLSATPTGSNKRLRYAYTGTIAAGSGPLTGPRGCLRDSDPTVSRHGYSLFNWCVHFDEAVP